MKRPLIITGFALALALLGVVQWLSWRHRGRLQEAQQWVAHTHKAHAARERLYALTLELESGQRSYALTGQNEFLELFERAVRGLAEQERRLLALVRDPEQQANLAILRGLIAERIAFARRTVELRRDSGREAAAQEIATLAGHRLTDQIRRRVAMMDARSEKLLEARTAAAARESAASRRQMALATALSMGLLIAVVVVLLRENRLRAVAADRLAVLHRRQEEIARSVADGLHGLNHEGKIDFQNPAAERMLGYTSGEALGLPAHQTIHHHRADGTEYPVEHCPIYATLRDGQTRAVSDEVFWRKDGTSFPVEYVVSSIHDEAGRRRGAIVAFRDVTERRAQEQALRRAHDELSHANIELGRAARLKDEFLANMSHELRTPLNAILGLSEALLEQTKGTLTARQIQSITTISNSGHHLLSLINDVLDLSKIEAGMMTLQPDTVDCDALSESCLGFIRNQAMRKGIAISFETDAPGAQLEADPRRLKQILLNLLTNAVKFTPEGGRVGLTLRAAAGAGTVQFSVWDTGIGIAASERGKLFQPFTQIDSGLARAQEGTGLGLALVARLVDLHRGSVVLQSEPGEGSRFTITLPQTAGRKPAPPPPEPPEPRPFHRALIVDDDATSVTLLAGHLEALGVAYVECRPGDDPVATALRDRPDFVLLDILMPNQSGWTVLARLKDHPATRDLPVVIVSVVDEPEKSRALGAFAYLTKPVKREQLARLLRRPTNRVPLPVRPGVAAPAPTGPLILLAEDNDANIETIGGYLEDRGYTMHYAANGFTAVKLAREQRPALILMDVQMPVMDGLAAMRELRTDPALRATPIIALTALAMPGDRERCLAAGANEYLAKPVSLKALAELVERLLAAGAAGKANAAIP